MCDKKKLDLTSLERAKQKPPLETLLRFSKALEVVANISGFGDKQYAPGSWQYIDDKELDEFCEKRLGSLMRHLFSLKGNMLAIDDGEKGSQQEHLAAVAWNALAVLELQLRQEEKDSIKTIDWEKSRAKILRGFDESI